MSIQNITNLKELTERRVLEEEEKLADAIYQKYQDKLIETSTAFSDFVAGIEGNDYASIRFIDTLEFIENPFIINLNGSFLWPAFIPDMVSGTGSTSASFNWNYLAAERYEFIEKNYSKALQSYLRAYNYAEAKPDSAQAVNAIARLYFKTNDHQQALEYYSILISSHCTTLDKNGLPYLNYALPQLLHLSDTGNKILILETINIVLARMISGEIHLNYSSDILMDEISSWINNNSFTETAEISTALAAINTMKKRFSFLLNTGEIIKEFVQDDKRVNMIPLMENIYSLTAGSDRSKEAVIMVYLSDNELVSGFVIKLDSLENYSIKVDIPSTFRFEYDVEIIEAQLNQLPPEGELIIVSKWNLAGPEKSFRVKLKNEDLVQAHIRRTSWIYGVAIVLLIGGMILGVFLIIRDIQREKYLSQLRSEFVSNVTHELKTPLTSIHMFAESILLGRVRTKSDQQEYLGIILKETDRLKRLINNILDFSKREKGKLAYHFVDVNISGLVRSAVNDLNYWTTEKKFKVTTKIEEDIRGHADQDALKQAIINLLSNAIKYSDKRKEIDVRCRQNDGLIFIEVEDQGIGIAKDKIDHIFDKFYRIESRNAAEKTGTGLGLTVVKDIVEAHKGEIRVVSKIDHGSTFTIVLNASS